MEFKESFGPRKTRVLENKSKENIEKVKQTTEIKNPEITELEEPMKKILKEMKEDINKGKYGVILGEDASGRLPALLFHQILTTLYKEKNFPSPEIRFFAGQRFWEQEQK